MDIYHIDAEGAVDLVKATVALRATDGMKEDRRRAVVAEITAAALLDIALSLRPISQEAALAMGGFTSEEIDDTDDTDDAEEDPLVEGDVVQVDGAGAPGTISGFRFTEGEYFAAVEWVDGVDLVAVSRLSRLVGDDGDQPDPLAEVVIEEEPPAPVIVAEEIADEIDDDFDGDDHADAEAALAKLKANEAARKAAKKKGTKK